VPSDAVSAMVGGDDAATLDPSDVAAASRTRSTRTRRRPSRSSTWTVGTPTSGS